MVSDRYLHYVREHASTSLWFVIPPVFVAALSPSWPVVRHSGSFAYEAVPWTGFPASASVNLLCPLPVDTGQQITSILSADAYMQTAEGVVRTQGVGR